MVKTFMLITTLTVILLAIGWVLGGLWGMLIALILSAAINFFSYWYSDKLVLRLYGAKPFQSKEIDQILEGICKEAKMPKPPLYKINTKIPNAFATGRDPKHAAIAVTEGLVDMEREEIEGVLAHEVSHIKNRDVLVGTLAATIAGAISYLAQLGYFMMFFGSSNQKGQGNIIGLILIVVFAPVAALLVRLAISRAREYKADWTGILITKNPKGLASALRKIAIKTREHPLQGNSATSHLWIVNPFRADWFTGLFSTHPAIEKRIERLEEARL